MPDDRDEMVWRILTSVCCRLRSSVKIGLAGLVLVGVTLNDQDPADFERTTPEIAPAPRPGPGASETARGLVGGAAAPLARSQVEVRPETSRRRISPANAPLRVTDRSAPARWWPAEPMGPTASRWNFLGLFLARADRLQARPHLIVVRPGPGLSTDRCEDHHLFEGRSRCVDAQSVKWLLNQPVSSSSKT